MDADPLDRTAFSFLIGPTAVGKSALALELAERSGAEIVSMDSMQVYRGMDIGTAKASAEEQARVPHHGIDRVGPEERYDVQRYLADVREVLTDLEARGARALFVGGTAFYLKALVRGLFGGPPVDLAVRAAIEERADELGSEGLHAELARRDPVSSARIHPNDRKRVVRALEVLEQTGRPLSAWQQEWGWGEAESKVRPHRIVSLVADPDAHEERMRRRIARMLDRGWAEEALAIRDGGGFGPTSIQALGYQEVLEYADGKLGRKEVEDLIQLRTRQFARRQRAWFRSFEGSCRLQAPGDVGQALAFLGWS